MSTPSRITPAPRDSATLPILTDAVQYVSGVGPRRAPLFAKLGIRTAQDLIEYLPLRHERQEFRTTINLDEGMVATVVGRIAAVKSQGRWRNSRVVATLIDNSGRCTLTWFNAAYVAEKIERGVHVQATGRVSEFQGLPQLVNPSFEILGDDAEPVDESQPPRFVPVYPATQRLTSRQIGAVISRHLSALIHQVREIHPPDFLRQRRLLTRHEALRAIHQPRSEAEIQRARQRLAYDELFLLQITVHLARHKAAKATAPAMPSSSEIDRRIRARLPFALTAGQNRAVAEIAADLAVPRPMNRLLQGDVGCGKTVVALYAALVAVANHHQAALMAPTELLARQHFKAVSHMLRDSRVRMALLTGSLPKKSRQVVLAELSRGEIDLVIGTHALIQDDVDFARLGLVIVDEQHRFGVRQRAVIRAKGPTPHYLVMTATPIPRTLAMSVFGDLDVTTIEDLPPGRTPVTTRVVGPARQDAAWQFVRTQLEVGRQAYIVYPIIDESDTVQARAAVVEFQRLSKQIFAGRKLGLLHGRLKPAERDRIMADFAAGKLDALVATTIIEVGIDVPNASTIVIEHAEHYGLSQLHQLRGRVGRGRYPGHCLLMTDSPAAEDNERLAVLARTTDGFKIAEEDLRIRGPGEMLGTRQHGLPELRAADLARDVALLRAAQQDAAAVIRTDPGLSLPAHAALRAAIAARQDTILEIAGVG